MATLRQKKAFKAVVENGGIVSTAMIEAGYTPATAKTPQKLTDSDGWQELMNQHLPDSSLAKKHKQLLNAINLEKVLFNKEDSNENIKKIIDQMEGYKLIHIHETINSDGGIVNKYAYVKAPDNMTQEKALDKAYKLKGSYAPEKSTSLNLNIESRNSANPELEAIRQDFINKLKEKLI